MEKLGAPSGSRRRTAAAAPLAWRLGGYLDGRALASHARDALTAGYWESRFRGGEVSDL